MIAGIRYTLASELNERPSLLTMMDGKKRRAKVDQDLLFATVDVFSDRPFGGNRFGGLSLCRKVNQRPNAADRPRNELLGNDVRVTT